MKHLSRPSKVWIFLVSILILSVHYNIVQINFNQLLSNVGNIIGWVSQLMLGAIIASKLRK